MAKHNLILSFFLILIGIIFLLDLFEIIPGISKIWPVFILLLGFGFWLIFFSKKKSNIAELGAGTFLVALSILFFYLNFTTWTQISELWPIFLVIFGFLIFVCYFSIKSKIFLYIGLLLMILGVVFYLVFAISAKLWPISLILLGISFMALKEVK